MKARTTLLALAICLVGVTACFAADNNEGSFKLNEAKSKIPAGSFKNTSVVYTAEGDQYKCVVEGVDGSGQPLHNEWTGKFDGKDYAVTGDPTSDTRAMLKTSNTHYKLTSKKDGKTVMTGTVDFSADGKTRTLVVHSKDANGKSVTSKAVYDRE